MSRTEIIAALRAAIALLEDGAPKAVAAPRVERRPAPSEAPATKDERRSFRAGRVRYADRKVTQSGRDKLRVGIEWRSPEGEMVVDYYDSFDEAVLAQGAPEIGSEVQAILKPWKDTHVIIGLTVMGPPLSASDAACGFDADEIPF